MNNQWIAISGIVRQGHRVASGTGPDRTYPKGTIHMQKPFFAERGLDLGQMHDATMNIELVSGKLRLRSPDFLFSEVEWTDLHPPEDFYFWKCRILHAAREYPGWVYHPSAATKAAHFQADAIIEILAPFIESVRYGDPVELSFPAASADVLTGTADRRIIFPELAS